MKTIRPFQLLTAIAISSLLHAHCLRAQAPAASPAAAPSAAALDFGDFNSSGLTTKAWKALESKNYAAVAGYTGKCIEMYKGKAVEMQKSLTEPPNTSPENKEKVFANWALNDVGTCYFILGKSLEEQGKPKEALEAYKFVADNLAYAQCWDPKGWFWSPANAAKERVAALGFDAIK